KGAAGKPAVLPGRDDRIRRGAASLAGRSAQAAGQGQFTAIGFVYRVRDASPHGGRPIFGLQLRRQPGPKGDALHGTIFPAYLFARNSSVTPFWNEELEDFPAADQLSTARK
ncbi:MAG: hypothetical protein KDJ74_13690, partial [Notoacmeibacter sp.]|nr:hypothetical protein [Notoacmeibacter sp.]